MEKHRYIERNYPLSKMVSRYLEVRLPLDKLHVFGVPEGVLTREEDQSLEWHTKFYKRTASLGSLSLYKEFIQKVLCLYSPFFGEERLVYQRVPNLRIQFPDNIAVGEWHRDKDYGHNTKEWNIFLPLTSAYNTNTIWAETEEGKEDYQPLEANPGEFIIWKGVDLKHGNKVNGTRSTRVSLDFRVIPYSEYKEQVGESINTNTPFRVGGYYDVMEVLK